MDLTTAFCSQNCRRKSAIGESEEEGMDASCGVSEVQRVQAPSLLEAERWCVCSEYELQSQHEKCSLKLDLAS